MKPSPTFNPGTISHGTLNTAHLLSAYIQAFEGFALINGDYFSANHDERDRIANLIGEAQDCFDDEGDDIRTDKQEIATELVNDDFPRLFDRYAPDSHAFGSHEGDGSDLGFWQYDAD